jgi:hypothetical protein
MFSLRCWNISIFLVNACKSSVAVVVGGKDGNDGICFSIYIIMKLYLIIVYIHIYYNLNKLT